MGFYVTNHHGQRIEGERGNSFSNISEAKFIADSLRTEAVRDGFFLRHYHVMQIETVYVTSVLDDVLTPL